MANWYCGSVQYAAVVQFAISHAYSVGDIVRQLAAPAVGNERCFRCTTAGTTGGSEGAWNLSKGATTTQGTAVFTEVTGDATYNWSAPHARLQNAMITGWPAAGDSVYVAHNHAETSSAAINTTSVGTDAAPLNVICVNAAGSVPPVSADLRTTATVTTTGASQIRYNNTVYFYGITWTAGSGVSGGGFQLDGNSGARTQRYDNCNFVFGTTAATTIALGLVANTNTLQQVLWNNVTLTFAATGQSITQTGNFLWRNTASAIGGATFPTTLFTVGSTIASPTVFDGIDLSALGSGKTLVAALSVASSFLFLNCKLNASVTVAATPTSAAGGPIIIDNSDSTSSGNRQERYHYSGTLTREQTIVRSGGASDGVAAISWKVVTTSNALRQFPFETFPIAVWNATVGSVVTATVEIVNDGVTLKDTDVWLEIEYLGSSATPLASLASDGVDILAAGSALATSTATWTTTGIASPVKQKLVASFTPQLAGLVRAAVKVARASTTIYVDPLVTLA